MMLKKRVWVVYSDTATEVMFRDAGYDPIVTMDDSWPTETFDFICFTGGSDVHPSFYGEKIDGARGFDIKRDIRETQIIHRAREERIPMVGICRGGQLLNVMMGGSMIQDHGLVSGIVSSANDDGEVHWMHVDHHQGMVARTGFGNVDLVGAKSGSNYSITYPVEKIFCFQPHPEWGHGPTENYFFDQLEKIL